ncbi:MAG: hypothetical protein ACE5EB_03985 [Thermodesulfobacteriota bacterium]
MKEKIRPIYSELQGYLTQAPSSGQMDIASIREQLNSSIDELNLRTEKDYSIYKIAFKDCYSDGRRIQVDIYKFKLGGLIARLHGEYFSVESAPFTGMPSTVIHTTQTQSQSIDFKLTLLLNVQNKIDEQLPNFPEGSKEKTFLQKLKSSLPGIKDATQLLFQLFTLAKSSGLSVDDLSKIFS